MIISKAYCLRVVDWSSLARTFGDLLGQVCANTNNYSLNGGTSPCH